MMEKENQASACVGKPTARVTRAQAAASRASGRKPPIPLPKQPDQKRVVRPNSKRAALDETSNSTSTTAVVQHKKRAVLKDVTNVCCDSSYKNCLPAAKLSKKSKQAAIKIPSNVSKVARSIAEKHLFPADSKSKVAEEAARTELKSSEVGSPVKLDKNIRSQRWIPMKGCSMGNNQFVKQSDITTEPKEFPKRENQDGLCGELIKIRNPEIMDIDADLKDSLLCSLYAPDIYNFLRVAELKRRPCTNFSETVQRDITQSMRGILVDWLVEVSEEYKLVPDTLYLTVQFIDLFLSENYIERSRLQLLGITCMLIASKYEEICAPRVEEFCFITDNTYTRDEVLKMETQVLNYLGFHLSAPTAKTFLRRFLRAAQASNKSPSLKLELLANYLTELTLVDYEFLKFLPSLTAASAVFLARWTLDQSSPPWNITLEHYTTYKASDLKTSVLALQGLQLNKNGCPLNAIRAKYRQIKFESVASLSSPELLHTFFDNASADLS